MAERNTNISVRTVVILCLSGAFIFSLAFYKTIENKETSFTDSPGSTTFSTSALGHSAMLELLRELKLPVDVYRYSSGALAQRFYGNLLILAEPGASLSLTAAVKGASDAGAVLIVLPKRAPAGFANGNRITASEIFSADRVEDVLRGTIDGWHIVRPETPASFDIDALNVTPTIKQPQLLTKDTKARDAKPDAKTKPPKTKQSPITPIVSSKDGILLGEFYSGKKKIWILSDPDVIANHGLANGDNAAFVVRLLEKLTPDGKRILFDETIHGFSLPPTLWLALFQPPWIAVTLAFLALTTTLGFAALNRYGAAVELPTELKPGKQLLIENTAGVLSARGSSPWIIGEYARTTVRDTALKLRLPPRLRGLDAMLTALTEAERGKKISQPIRSLWAKAEGLNKATSAAPLDVARDFNQWRQEMLNEPRRNQNA